MLSFNRRAVLAALGTNGLAGPLLAQGRPVAPVGFTGRVVTSHIVEGASGLAVVDGRFQPHAAIELLPGLIGYLEAVKPLLAANIGKPDQAKAMTDEIAKAFPAYQLSPLLRLGSSRSLQS
jgi:hypothetical protein